MKNFLIKLAGTVMTLAVATGTMSCSLNSSFDNSENATGGTTTSCSNSSSHNNAIPAGFVKIAGATVSVNIGDSDGPFCNAGTSPVTVNAFYMAETELTYSKWYEVYTWATADARGDKKYIFSNEGREGADGIDGAVQTAGDTEPVTYVSWRDAVVWCNAASEKEGLVPVYYLEGTTDFTDSTKVLRLAEDYDNCGTVDNGTDVAAGFGKAENAVINTNANGYRLPTEAEWELAARGGDPANTTVWSCTYAGTNSESELGNYAVYNSNSDYDTANVKSKGDTGKNSAGLWDMSGNVWEWCWNNYASSSSLRVIRGGGWGEDASFCTVSNSCGSYPSNHGCDVGFRVVRSIAL